MERYPTMRSILQTDETLKFYFLLKYILFGEGTKDTYNNTPVTDHMIHGIPFARSRLNLVGQIWDASFVQKVGQIISINGGTVQVMDSESFETIDVAMIDESVEGKLENGQKG